MCIVKQYALELEYGFHQKVTADEFEVDLQGSIEMGIGYLHANGDISQEETSDMLKEFSCFKKLKEAVADNYQKEKLDQLISQLKDIKKRQIQ